MAVLQVIGRPADSSVEASVSAPGLGLVGRLPAVMQCLASPGTMMITVPLPDTFTDPPVALDSAPGATAAAFGAGALSRRRSTSTAIADFSAATTPGSVLWSVGLAGRSRRPFVPGFVAGGTSASEAESQEGQE